MFGFDLRKITRHGWLLFALLSITACGGGGGSSESNESSSSASSDTGTTPPSGTSSSSSSSSSSSVGSVSFLVEPTLIQVSAYSFSSAAISRSISVGMAIVPASARYLSGRYSTKGIKTISVDWDRLNHATITVNFKSSAELAPGTYSDSVQIRLCAESPCSAAIDGVVTTVPVTFTVVPPSGAGAPAVTLWQQRSINQGAQYGVDTMGPVSVGFGLSNFVDPPYISATAAGTAINSVSGSASTVSGQVTTNLHAPQALGSGSHAGNITVKVCLDGPPCVYQAIGSPFQIPASYVVYEVVKMAAIDIVWDSVSQRIYATEAGSSSGTGFLTKVNPATKTIDWRLPIAAGPSRLAVSPDGMYAYVSTMAVDAGLNQSDPKIRKYRLSDRTQLWAISLPGTISDFRVSPGAGTWLAVSNSSGGLSMYNTSDGALIDSFASPSSWPEKIVWGSSASVLYSYDVINDVLREFAPTSSSFGFVSNKNVDLNAEQMAWSGLHYDKGLLMENHGAIYNVATGTVISRLDVRTEFTDPNYLPFSIAAAFDMAIGRSYFWYNAGGSVVLQAFDVNTGMALGNFPTISRSTFSLIRWGMDGLAYLHSASSEAESGIALVQGSFVAP